MPEKSSVKHMTEKQKRFCDEYLACLNAKQAAIKAGYSKKTAAQMGQENLNKPYLREYIDEQLARYEESLIVSREELLRYMSSVVRGESKAQIVMTVGTGDGVSEVVHVMKAPDEKERLKAAELLGRAYGIFNDRLNISEPVPVVLSGAADLEE